MRPFALALVVCSLAAAAPARAADPIVLRFATVAPEGTSWAREMHAMGREVSEATNGQVTVKWYFGAIAGDDVQSGQRVARGQLDGVVSGGMLCQQLAPSLRILRIPGLLQDQAQTRYVLNRLRPFVNEEFEKSGYVNLTEVVIGPSVIFSREPVTSMEDLRRLKMWRWDLDETANQLLTAMGAKLLPLPLEAAGRAYDQHEIDGFSALPAAALAFQWSTQARYVTNLPMDFLVGCVVVATHSLDRLQLSQRQLVVAAAAKMALRAEDVEQQMTGALINGLFAKHGLKTVPLSTSFRTEFFVAARDARERRADQLVPRQRLQKVMGWIADFYGEGQSRR